MKLKDIIEEGLGGFVGLSPIHKLESKVAKQDNASLLKIAKELVAKEEDDKLMNREELISNVNEFASYGPSIYKKHNLSEVADTFVEISKAAQKHVVEETADWFDRVTVQRNMNDLKKQAAGFSKISTEAQALQDRMAALYEDMGVILNRYYDIPEGEDKVDSDETKDQIEEGDYEAFFQKAMKKFGISSPDELGSDEKKKKFFNYVDKNYSAKAEGKI